MRAGDIIRVLNSAGGIDFFYMINEIQMGDTGRESIVIMTSLSRLKNQSARAGDIHQIPYPLIYGNANYEVYRGINHD